MTSQIDASSVKLIERIDAAITDLNRVSACDPECGGRCKACPDDVAKAAVFMLAECKSALSRNERDSFAMNKEYRKLKREISRLKTRVQSAHDQKIAAQTRAHDSKLRAKTAEYGLRGLQQRCMKAEAALHLDSTPGYRIHGDSARREGGEGK